ncbi:MAG TPA: B12-binding domain-containing protein, partial [Bacillota bacterium]|nr:B12-binding domain-containing protein [Bacillota bacterium]
MEKEALFKDAFDSIIDCDEDKAMEVLKVAEAEGIDPVELLTEGFSAGIKHLGDLFGRGEVFLPELIFSAEVMKTVTAEIESKMDASQISNKGVLVIGTVEGDVHDIGKGIVASLVKTNGFEVHDIGREVPAEVFIEKVKEYNADFLGSSALLT